MGDFQAFSYSCIFPQSRSAQSEVVMSQHVKLYKHLPRRVLISMRLSGTKKFQLFPRSFSLWDGATCLKFNSVCCPLVGIFLNKELNWLNHAACFVFLFREVNWLHFLSCCVLSFSELLHSLDVCGNDPVAIAQCFVDKVRGKVLFKVMKAISALLETKPWFGLCFLRVKTLKYTPSIAPTTPSK